MAELDGLRAYALTDEQADYSPDIYLPVDDVTFTNTKKIKLSTIYPLIDTLTETTDITPSTAELRISVATGDERRISVTNLLQDSDVISIIKTLGSTGWKTYVGGDVVRNSTKIDANTLVVNVIEVLGMVTLTGQIKFDSVPGVSEVLLTLPASIDVATKDIYFNSSDAQNGDNTEFIIGASGRTITAQNTSTGDIQVFCVTYPTI